ncbi:MAG: 3-hydroxyacyl-ACP dehydratase FabZ [Magnetococcales bacterium]|nr:3-hydroxyacyl-ACP dehydratase FabZ [Magnetococcales bacterium]
MDYLNNPEAILKSLPHRYPFLMIDRVVDSVKGKSLTAIKNVTFNEPHFMGHFPDNPVMPGVLILESMAQAGALFAASNDPESTEGCLVYFMSIDKARFRKPVVPGDQLRIEITLLKRRRDIWRFQGKSYVEDKLVSEAEFMAMTSKETK